MTNKRLLRLYLAAPLFNERERVFNEQLARELEEYAEVFLPQRDGAILAELVAGGVPLEVAEQRVFDQDTSAMAASDLMLAVLDGGHVDEGVAFEIGYMRALGKLCIGLQTDVRRALPTGNNPMIAKGLHAICTSAVEAGQLVHEYFEKRIHIPSGAGLRIA